MSATTVDIGVVEVEQIESWQLVIIYVVTHVWWMGKVTEGLQKIQEEFEAENEGVAIPAQEWWLAHHCSLRGRRQTGETAASVEVFVVEGNKVAQHLVKKDIKAAWVLFRVEMYTNLGPASRREFCSAWGHIENKCSSEPTFGNCSGHHWNNDHRCKVLVCSEQQGSLCGHTPEKCPNSNATHIAFGNRCAKNTEASSGARQ